MKKKKFLAIVLALSMILSLLPVNYAFAAGATGDFTVSGGTLGTDYSYSGNVLTVLKSTKLTISGTTTTDRIEVASGVQANLVLSNLSITTSYTNNSDNSPLSLKDAGESVITLQGDNTLDGSGADNYAPGIFVPNGSLLTINGTGKLTAKGSTFWPGIGRNGNGNIKIESGEITAIGSTYAAGIGGSNGHDGGNITINGGKINATSSTYGAGIGSRDYDGGNITINGGTITATGGVGDSSIMSGPGIAGNIIINGGTITANSGVNTSTYGRINYGIGGTLTTGTNGNAFIITNSIQNTSNSADWSGVIFIGNSGKVYGNPTIATDAEIPSGKTLTIESGMSMTVGSGTTLTNNGTIIVNEGGLLANNGSIANNGTITINAEAQLANNGTIEGRGTITNDGKVVNTNSIVCKGNIKRNGTLENSGAIELIFDTNDIVFDGEVTIPAGITVTNEGKFYVKDSCTLTINGKLNNQGEILYFKPGAVPDNLEGNLPVALFTLGGEGTPSTVSADGADVTITDAKITYNHSILGAVDEPLDPDGYIFKGSTGSLNITVSQPFQFTLDNATIVTGLSQMMSVNGVVNINLIGENTIGFNKKDGDRGSRAGITMTDASEIHFSTETDGSVTIMGNYNYWWDAPAAVKGGNLYVESGTVTAIGGGTTYGPANGGSVGKAFNGKTLTVNGGTFNGYYQTGSYPNGSNIVINSGTAMGETLAETIKVAEGAVLNTKYRSLAVDTAEISLICTEGQTADLPSATVTISNSGNLKSQGLQAQGSSKLNVAFSKNEIDAGGSITATVTPKENLTAGEYTEVVTVQGSNNEKIQFTVKLKVKEKITFEVSGTEQVYKAGEAKTITFVPSALSADDFVVKYYEVDENNGVLKSTQPVSRAIASGCYLYVIDLLSEQEDYGIGSKFTVTDTALPDVSAYDNVGYMYINATAEQQLPIFFENGAISLKVGETYTNTLTNGNTVSYTSSNPAIVAVDAASGEITALKPGTATITATSTKVNTTPVYAGYTVTVRQELTTADFTVTAAEKDYDGTTAAKVTATVKADSPADSGDVINATAEGTFDKATAGDRTVSYEIVSILGKNADKYVLADNMTGTVTGKINKAEVTIVCAETTTRTYNGNPQTVDVSAMANGKVLASSDYTVKYNGEPEAVAVGSYPITVQLNDAAAVNYEIKTQPNATLEILSASQDVFSIENVPDTVYYGDKFTVSTYGAAGDVTYEISDDVLLKDIATIDESGNVAISGVGRVTITATSQKAGYEDRVAVKTFEVKKRILTPTATATNRTYNGENSVDVAITLNNLVNGDDITATAGGSMVNADAGNGKIVYVSGITLSDDTNYTLSTQSLQTTVDIAPIAIDGFTVTSQNKTYDGTDTAQVAVTAINGVLNDDLGQVAIVGTASYGAADVGEYNVTYNATGLSGAKAGNYKLTATQAVTADKYKIEAMEITFAIGQTSFVYDGTDKKITVSASDSLGRVFNDYTISYFDGNDNEVTPNKAGSYTAKITLNSNNYTTAQADIPVTITEATQDQLVIAGLPGTVQYGDSFQLEAYGGADGGKYQWEVVSGNAELSSTDTEKTTVSVTGIGKVEIKVTKTSDNYKDIAAKTVFAASPKNVAFEIGNLEQTYGNVTAVTVTPSDKNATYEITYDGNATLPADAGKYKVKVTATDENYSGKAEATLIINKATARGSINVKDSYTYGDTVVAEATGLIDGTTAEITYAGTGIYVPQATAPKNAGTYTAIATITGDNYETLTVTKEFKIEKANLTVKAADATRAFGEANPVFTIEYDGFKYGENKNVLLAEPVATVKANASSPVGEYDITVSGGSAENYKFVYDNTGKLTVTGASQGQLVIMGATNTVNVGQEFTLQAFYGNTKVDVDWSSDNTAVATIDAKGTVKALQAGTVKITATADENYSNATADITITVKQSNITLVPINNVRTYNGERQDIAFAPNADFTPVLSGEGKNVNVTYTLVSDPTVTQPIQAGTYSVVYTIEDESYSGGGNTTMYINKATLKAEVCDDDKIYGDEYTGYDLKITDKGGMTDAAAAAALADMKAVTTYASDGAAKTAPVKEGGYEITATLAKAENDNVKFVVENGTLTVTPAPLTIKVKDVSREYGAENPALEVEYEGFKNGETEAVLTGDLVLAYDESINAETPVGTYNGKTKASGVTADNYEIRFVPGDVTVTKIGVKASAGNATSSYLTVKLDKGIAGLTADNFVVKNGEELIALTEATASSDNKTYTLKGTFSPDVTYTVEIDLAGTASDEIYEITGDPLAIKPTAGGGGGGGAVTAEYTVTFETNGGSKVESVKVSENDTLAKPTEPTKEGYTFAGWYTDQALTQAYDFTDKVTKSFTLYAKWTENEPEAWANPFTDVAETDWFYDDVEYVYQNGLMGGTTDTTFSPNAPLTRGMLVTVLYRAEGEPAVNSDNPFNDVNANAYYADAVIWAQQNGIVNGITENTFAPDQNISREQIATIIYRYAQYKGYDVSVGEDTNILSYTDAESISDYAVEAMQYMVGAGLMNGKTETTINPKDNATRAEIAAILHRFMEANK